MEILGKLQAKGADFHYENGKYPRLIDWMKRSQETVHEKERSISYVR